MTETVQEIEDKPIKKNYVDKEELLTELKLLKTTGAISNKLHLMFYDIAKNYAHINKFRNYSFIEDMVVEGYINCVLVADKYDTEAGTSAFSYFTTTIHRNFLKFIIREGKQQKRKWKELKIVYEQYQIDNNIKLTLPDNIIEKMYEVDPVKVKPVVKKEVIVEDIYENVSKEEN